MTSDRRLRRWYNAINRKYYAGQLPEDVELWWEPVAGGYADTSEIERAPGTEPQLLIRIDPSLIGMPEIAQMKLRHECIHVAQWGKKRWKDHGKKFHQELDRLYAAGAFRNLI